MEENIILNEQDNSVSLKFNYKFYDKEKIKQAIVDFSKVCDATETSDILILKPKTEITPKILGFEFYNYVLGLMKNS